MSFFFMCSNTGLRDWAYKSKSIHLEYIIRKWYSINCQELFEEEEVLAPRKYLQDNLEWHFGTWCVSVVNVLTM